jgi:hypothetical protein
VTRLSSLHPSYLDQKVLVAVWREGLLAGAVLRGATRGYRHHPQLAHLNRKAHQRAPAEARHLPSANGIGPHPMFSVRQGPVEDWEKGIGD